MYSARHFAQLVWLCLFLLGPGSIPSLSADPQHYPQFAQQPLDSAVPIEFISAAEVKQRLDTALPQVVVDVRDRDNYDKVHIPGAISMPLEAFPTRLTELPNKTPIVLY